MATRAAIAGLTVAALVTLGLAAGFARAQTSAPPRLGDTVRVSPPPASRGGAPAPSGQAPSGAAPSRPATGPGPARTGPLVPRQDVRAVPSPVPPASDDDDEVEADADDGDADD